MIDLCELGERPPLGEVPRRMHAYLVRQNRFGQPRDAWRREIIPTPTLGPDEVLIYVMASGINYNNVWAALGAPLDVIAERQRAGEPVSLHMNISSASLTDLSVLEFIERRLDEGEADPARCTFELTQTSRVEDFDAAAGFADRLTEFGCEVAIDDYGAGFGPFAFLKKVPFDVIKIDGTFIRDMPRNDADQLVVKAIVEIARGLGKRTIAEFVEDEDTKQLLREYGVDMAQGYHLGRPVDSAELSAA
jgi:EAL domain-containing protein (putative c-di-GMP-specific phosphodiesterase class I)